MSTRVTIQDIADELGISRNTVSKAINNTGVLADSTREKVLKKAMEMGYKQFSYVTVTNVNAGNSLLSLPAAKKNTEIALFIANFIDSSHFASVMLDKFQKELFPWTGPPGSSVSKCFTMNTTRCSAAWACRSYL